MSTRIKILSLVAITVLTLSGCWDKEPGSFTGTTHPDKGGIILTADWSNAGTTIPTTYHASIISTTGNIENFPGLSGTTNTLVVEPGQAMAYVYNDAENITVSGKKVTVTAVGVNVAAIPGRFFCFAGKISTERDRDVALTALMNQQTKELGITLAIKPASMIHKVRSINATLHGVASELDMQTNVLSAPSAVAATFSKDPFLATATLNMLGIVSSTKQNLDLDVELIDGNIVTVSSDLSSLMAGFNSLKNTSLSLNSDLIISDDETGPVTVGSWNTGTKNGYLSVSPFDINFSCAPSTEIITITTDQPSWVYSVAQTGNWLTVTKTSNGLDISATGNTGKERQATIHISAADLSEKLTITQEVFDNLENYYTDREVVKIQNATTGKGVNIVLMGDGYTIEDMHKGTGKYEQDMRTAAGYFFSVYPLTIYRDYFNVYMVAAVSEQAGISVASPLKTVDTKLGSKWDGGKSTRIECNDNAVFKYLTAITELTSVKREDITIIVPINANIYAGTCWMYYPTIISNYASGASICLCPAGDVFREVIVHESAGHGFAKLRDEYIYQEKGTIPDDDKTSINTWKKYGWFENVDFYSNITQTSWSGFANVPKYNMVGTFEGASEYGKGIWRPENNSCMNDNVFYFNAPSRWAQVRRIKQLAGISYTFVQFLQDDVVPPYPGNMRTASTEKTFVPFAPPVIKEKTPD